MLRHHHHYIHVAPISTRKHSMSPPANPYKKKPPPSSGSMIIENPYKKQRSHLASGATLADGHQAMTHQATKMHHDESIDPRSEAAWITPRKDYISRSNYDDGDRKQSAGNNKENVNGTRSMTAANPGERGRNDDQVPWGLVTPATIRKQNAKDKEESGGIAIDLAMDDDDAINKLGSTVVSVFKVFASGIVCNACNNKPIGSSIASIRRHMKESHPLLFCDISNFSKFHSSIIRATDELKLLHPPSLPVDSAGPVVVRLKCLHCLRSFGKQYNYNKHVRQSNGRCTGSIPITTEFTLLESGRFVDVTAGANPPSLSLMSGGVPGKSIVPGFMMPLPFKIVEQKILKYILDDEDSDTFVSLFTPLLQDNVHFESRMCELIDRYKNPPAVHEQSLQTILLMGERWLFERARHEVSVIPGNYRASLIRGT
jgi:hypothetical protein